MAEEVEFDGIAPIYDETRSPPSEEELSALIDLLDGGRRVLDAGVGTGRFAAPLMARGFEVIGVDLSLAMMRRARPKGIVHLVRADVGRLPLRDRAVDVAFMAHVIQLITDPRPVLRELGRVARTLVVLEVPGGPGRERGGAWREVRDRYRTLAAEMGYPLPERAERHWHTVEELSAIAEPSAVRVVQPPERDGRTREERIARWLNVITGTNRIPAAVHEEIVRRILSERALPPSGERPPRIARLVAWPPERLQQTSSS